MKFPFARFEVAGNSMLPAFRPGQRVIVFRWGKIKPGDAVVFYKEGMVMLKRVAEMEAAREPGAVKKWLMRGDNLAESTDSLDFGAVDEERIIGKVLCWN